MTTALLRLTWKEYRANRAFWIGLVVLAGLVQAALASLVTSADAKTSLIFMFALGVPAFFAVGSSRHDIRHGARGTNARILARFRHGRGRCS